MNFVCYATNRFRQAHQLCPVITSHILHRFHWVVINLLLSRKGLLMKHEANTNSNKNWNMIKKKLLSFSTGMDDWCKFNFHLNIWDFFYSLIQQWIISILASILTEQKNILQLAQLRNKTKLKRALSGKSYVIETP